MNEPADRMKAEPSTAAARELIKSFAPRTVSPATVAPQPQAVGSTLVRVAHGVWRPAEAVADYVDRAMTLLAACPDSTVICGISAGWLHGMWLPTEADLLEPLEVIVHPDIAVLSRRAHGRRKQVRTRRQRVGASEVVQLRGLPVTSEVRTWIDLAIRLSPPDLVAVGDWILRGGTPVASLQESVARAANRPGVRKARAVLPFLDAGSRSRPESHLRYTLVAAGLPSPEVNAPIFNGVGEWLAEPDLSYEDVRLALEYNGREHADVNRTRRDITRALDMDDRGGWLTVTFGPVQVFGRPDQVVVTVRRLRAERRDKRVTR